MFHSISGKAFVLSDHIEEIVKFSKKAFSVYRNIEDLSSKEILELDDKKFITENSGHSIKALHWNGYLII
ncbi:hypothetical protein RB653_005878 [Dictyostelium firmibasis]|uniref:Uncharacterized protein n=1 Tax=Dictyostelium firmibasis TaxID=79012 RepID=A0AAN7Z4W0_9MYCE